jgi:beta-phosphoglucomutase-like phosphatase (HAD superfamily)
MPLEALIFDVDGTLAETEELHRRSFNDAFAALGLDWEWPPELYRELLQITGGKERIRHYVESARPKDGERALAEMPTLHKEKTRRYGTLVATGTLKPRPGVLRLMQEARAEGIKLAIATTSDPANVEALLKASFAPDAPSWFAVIGAGDMVPNKKPAPDVYQYVLKKLAIPAKDAIAIEDSENGLLAALAAGLTVVATPSSYTDTDDFSKAHVILSDIGDDEHAPPRRLGARTLEHVDLASLRKLVPE